MKIKICGIQDSMNMEAIAALDPDMMGFIFYPGSKRYMKDTILPSEMMHISPIIEKIGVFVNEKMDKLEAILDYYPLDGIQLHGDESPAYLASLMKILEGRVMTVIKAFGIDEQFNWRSLRNYEPYCDYFLFDTKSAAYGGSGHKFDWSLLRMYSGKVPFILSGGIDVGDLEDIVKLRLPNVYAVDMNSKLEVSPGLKDTVKVKGAIELIRRSNEEQ
jgi:phosphoribosylanthranilate isomerase